MACVQDLGKDVQITPGMKFSSLGLSAVALGSVLYNGRIPLHHTVTEILSTFVSQNCSRYRNFPQDTNVIHERLSCTMVTTLPQLSAKLYLFVAFYDNENEMFSAL